MKRDWNILLIGGSAGTGKTTLARQLSQYFKLPYIEVDDVRLIMQNTLKRKENPALFAFLEADKAYFENTPHQTIADDLLGISREVWKGLRVVIENHLKQKKPVIIEGDGIIPELLQEFKEGDTKAIFLYDEKNALHQRELQREKEGNIRGYEVSGRDNADPDKWRERYTSVAYLYGQMIKKQAEQNNYPTFVTRPIETLYDRVLKTIT